MAESCKYLSVPALALATLWAQPAAAACTPGDDAYHACVYRSQVLPMLQQQQTAQRQTPAADPRVLRCSPRKGGENCGYYWTSNGLPHYEFGRNGQGAFDGVFKRYHPNGKPSSAARYRNGKQHGEERVFYESGKLRARAVYQNGKEHGAYQGWYENGKPMFDTAKCHGKNCAPERYSEPK